MSKRYFKAFQSLIILLITVLYRLASLSILYTIARSDGRSPHQAYSINPGVPQLLFPLTILSISTILKCDGCTQGVKRSYSVGNRPSKKKGDRPLL